MRTDDNETPAAQAGYDLFVFGDSLSDIGEAFTKTSGSIPPSPPYFNGRFSNGPVAVETLADRLGFNLTPSTNFAIGGAQTGFTNFYDANPAIPELPGLLNEINQFKDQVSVLGAGAEDLYVVWAGGNDFLNLPPNSQPPEVAAAINTAVTNIATAVETLAQSGAKNIVVAKTPNLGRVPQSLQADLLEPLTGLSIAFNTALDSALNTLEGSLSETTIILSDLFTTGEVIAQDPAAFGFSNITDPFLIGLTPGNPSADPDQYFFWDQAHPTTRSHTIFAETFKDSILSGIVDDITRIGTVNDEKIVSFSGNDYLVGRGGSDLLAGNQGNDRLHGNGGTDTLEGGAGNDLLRGGLRGDDLIGGLNNDTIVGNGGADSLTGVDPVVPNPGRGEIDILTGGGRADVFLLGNTESVFYDDGQLNRLGWQDFALITDFKGRDTIQLHGEANDYRLKRAPRSLSLGTAILLKTEGRNELIGIVAGNTNLNLDSNAFSFV